MPKAPIIVYWTFINPLGLQQICATPANTYAEAIAINDAYHSQNIPSSIWISHHSKK